MDLDEGLVRSFVFMRSIVSAMGLAYGVYIVAVGIRVLAVGNCRPWRVLFGSKRFGLGSKPGRLFQMTRRDEPLGFWGSTIILLIVGLVLAIAGFGILINAPWISWLLQRANRTILPAIIFS